MPAPRTSRRSGSPRCLPRRRTPPSSTGTGAGRRSCATGRGEDGASPRAPPRRARRPWGATAMPRSRPSPAVQRRTRSAERGPRARARPGSGRPSAPGRHPSHPDGAAERGGGTPSGSRRWWPSTAPRACRSATRCWHATDERTREPRRAALPGSSVRVCAVPANDLAVPSRPRWRSGWCRRISSSGSRHATRRPSAIVGRACCAAGTPMRWSCRSGGRSTITARPCRGSSRSVRFPRRRARPAITPAGRVARGSSRRHCSTPSTIQAPTDVAAVVPSVEVAELAPAPAPATDPSEPAWSPQFDRSDDLGGLLAPRGRLLRRAFGTDPRP